MILFFFTDFYFQFSWTNKNMPARFAMEMIRFFLFIYFQTRSWKKDDERSMNFVASRRFHTVNRNKIRKFSDRMQWIMSQSRRSSVSIHDYPEHLNPFNDDITSTQSYFYRDGKAKDSKHKFWTFGRSRKKRSNSFSIKSTWWILF